MIQDITPKETEIPVELVTETENDVPQVKVKLTADPKEYHKVYYDTHQEQFKRYEEKRNHHMIDCTVCKTTLPRRQMPRHSLTLKHKLLAEQQDKYNESIKEVQLLLAKLIKV
jgi:hypothetical protein